MNNRSIPAAAVTLVALVAIGALALALSTGGAGQAARPLYVADMPGGWRWHRDWQPHAPIFGVLTGRAEVDALLREHPELEASLGRPLREAEVDFGTQALVLAYLGMMPSAGYEVKIVRVHEEAGELVVTVALRSPASDEFTAEVITYPADVVPIDRPGSDKARVRFVGVDGRALPDPRAPTSLRRSGRHPWTNPYDHSNFPGAQQAPRAKWPAAFWGLASLAAGRHSWVG